MAYCKLICTNVAQYSSPYFDTSQRLIRLISGDEKYLCFRIFEECCVPDEYQASVLIDGLICDYLLSDIVPHLTIDVTVGYKIIDSIGDTIQEGYIDVTDIIGFKIKIFALASGYYTLHLTTTTVYSAITTTIPVVVSG
ncbi:MAG: hypothetical protein WC936_06925 [Candidatus Nanoarchaeia archaeon]|jgi:hypothetical protein